MKYFKLFEEFVGYPFGVQGNEPRWVLEQLQEITVEYLNFENKIKVGKLTVNKGIAGDLQDIFAKLLRMRFPIAKIKPMYEYMWSDEASATDNNTSSFNYREVEGTTKLSDHALGLAIDINPFQNPWVHPRLGNLPPGSEYDESQRGTLTIEVVGLFKVYGFQWGGDWKNPDYQHFYKKFK